MAGSSGTVSTRFPFEPPYRLCGSQTTRALSECRRRYFCSRARPAAPRAASWHVSCLKSFTCSSLRAALSRRRTLNSTIGAMSKLSEPLKALINAGFARPGPAPASKGIRPLFERIAQDSASKNIATPCWLTIATATSMTMNSPASMKELFDIATASKDQKVAVETAEIMREVGLKCIGFNGIPRTINCLGAFRGSLPEDVVRSLASQPTR